MAQQKRVPCPKCRVVDTPGFDKKCRHCAAALKDGDERSDNGMSRVGRAARALSGVLDARDDSMELKCSSCEALVEENAKFCTSCGSSLGESATPPDARKVTCTFCAKSNAVTESACTRCQSPLFAEADDKDDEDEDDEENEDGDDEEEGDGRKQLFDRKKKQEQRSEGAVYLDIAQALMAEGNERGFELLAAQVVYCESDEDPEITNPLELAANPPAWVPQTYAKVWENAIMRGRPRTFIGAVHAFKGLVGSSQAAAA